MQYDDFRRSADIEDRRGDDSGGGGLGGGGLGLPMGGGGLGIGTLIVLGLVGYAFGIDPRILIGGAQILTGSGSQAPSYQSDRTSASTKTGVPTDEMGSMIAGVLGEIDDRWSEYFKASGQTYTGPKIVLFRNATNGGRCGMAQSAMGPFYCPPERKIFLDTGFSVRSRPAFTAVPAMPANSPRPISSPMKPAITCKTCSASCRA